MTDIKIVLEDGSEYFGKSFGHKRSAAGEMVFCTAMTGYPESLADPSYMGQILVMTYPLIGNYGVPGSDSKDGLDMFHESDVIRASGLIVTDYVEEYSHWAASKSLGQWMAENRIPGVCGADTRAITKRLQEKGTMLGKIVCDNQDIEFYDPHADNLVEKASCKEKIEYGSGSLRILLVDCGVKHSLIRCLTDSGATVVRVPWDYDFHSEKYDALLVSNGPGDPKKCKAAIGNIAKALEGDKPIMGVSLGCQLMGLAAGADTFRLKFGHRSHNQPVRLVGSDTTFITVQNHGFAINTDTLPGDWETYYVNLNDGTCEGIRHKTKPFFAVQFDPEASTDAGAMFEMFLEEARKNAGKSS